LSALVDATDVLTRFPRIGRAVPEIADPSFRELIVDRHRVIYEIKEDTVTVLSIFDAAMDARARLRILLRDND
jgi:plasmid stabilization system protein ParE